jgi:phosphoglycerate dehydrogenase-like enzyme
MGQEQRETRRPDVLMSARPAGTERRVVVLDDYQGVALECADWSEVRELASVDVVTEPFSDTDTLVAALAGYEVLCVMRERMPLPREVLERLPELRCVVTTGAANRSIDLAAADELGIVVSGTTNGQGRLATAELTWGLVLALARRIPQEDCAVREGRWQVSVGTTLCGRTLGLVGLGGVGKHVARYARAFGMEVLAWSRNLTSERALESQATCVSKEELLRRSDVVSIHTVLSDETVGLIDAAALGLMKPTALLVNTSRGQLVREEALVTALRAGSIAGAALDTFDREPLPGGHPLLELSNVVITPHLGYVTENVYAEFFAETVRSLLAYLRGRPIRVLAPADGSTGTTTSRSYEDA